MSRTVPEMGHRYLVTYRVARIPHRFSDVLVLGTGIAGLSAALEASSRPEVDVLLVSKDSLEESATRYAQGGIAAVLCPERTGDSIERHAEDTLEAGGGLCEEEAVRIAVAEGVDRVRDLLKLGVEFDRNGSGELLFTREGGHSAPRILHRGDTTGQEIERALIEAVRSRPNIHLLPHTFALDLLTSTSGRARARCCGALLCRPDGELEAAWAKTTVLATGGAGRLYRETTNPPVCTGDGLAMAFRAGAALVDLEFIQFHPTTLYVAGADRFLITEAARGEGGVLRDGRGETFMARFHPLADLAPRDVVSRAILTVMREQDENRVWLDLSALPREKIQSRFPQIGEFCRRFGIDILEQPIPVRPSAHYSLGGVQTNVRAETSLEGLLAAGEVACTGLHGANRLGSNSLLEGLVFGHRAGRRAAARAEREELPAAFSTDGQVEERSARSAGGPRGGIEEAGVNLDDVLTSLKSLLWYKVGVERNGEDLSSALGQIRSWIPYCLGKQFHAPRSWSLQNMLQTAYLITLSALRREESRGVHYRSDFPERDDGAWRRRLVIGQDQLEKMDRLNP